MHDSGSTSPTALLLFPRTASSAMIIERNSITSNAQPWMSQFSVSIICLTSVRMSTKRFSRSENMKTYKYSMQAIEQSWKLFHEQLLGRIYLFKGAVYPVRLHLRITVSVFVSTTIVVFHNVLCDLSYRHLGSILVSSCISSRRILWGCCVNDAVLLRKVSSALESRHGWLDVCL